QYLILHRFLFARLNENDWELSNKQKYLNMVLNIYHIVLENKDNFYLKNRYFHYHLHDCRCGSIDLVLIYLYSYSYYSDEKNSISGRYGIFTSFILLILSHTFHEIPSSFSPILLYLLSAVKRLF